MRPPRTRPWIARNLPTAQGCGRIIGDDGDGIHAPDKEVLYKKLHEKLKNEEFFEIFDDEASKDGVIDNEEPLDYEELDKELRKACENKTMEDEEPLDYEKLYEELHKEPMQSETMTSEEIHYEGIYYTEFDLLTEA